MTSPSRRTLIARELNDTEQNYVKNLSCLVTILIPTYRPILSTEQFSSLFSNIESILITQKEFATSLLDTMATWDDHKSLLGPIFSKYLPFLKPYKQYSANYDYAQNVYTELETNDKFIKTREKLLREQGAALGFVQDLTHWLIMPVQRIPRYILLLKELISNTPSNHPDLDNLQVALKSVEELARLINTEIKLGQSRAVVRQLCAKLDLDATLMCQPYRYFLMDGLLFKHTPRSNTNPTLETALKQLDQTLLTNPSIYGVYTNPSIPPSPTQSSKSVSPVPISTSLQTNPHLFKADLVIQYQFFLFTDLLIYATQSKGKLTSHHVIPLDQFVCIHDPYPTEPTFYLSRDNNRMSLKLSAPTLALKQLWFEQIFSILPTNHTSTKVIQQKTNNLDIMISSPLDFPSSESSSCSSCGKGFGLTTHRHTCKYCCEIICDDCASQYEKVTGTKKELRICNQCKRIPAPNSQYLNTIAETSSLNATSFIIPQRVYLDQFEVLKVGQNGIVYPYRCILFNDLMLLSIPKPNTAIITNVDSITPACSLFTPPNSTEKHIIVQMIPIDHQFKVVPNDSITNMMETYTKLKEKNKIDANTFIPHKTALSMYENESKQNETNAKQFPLFYRKSYSFYISHDTLLLKLYLVSSTPYFTAPTLSLNEKDLSKDDSMLKQHKEMVVSRFSALAAKHSTCLPTNMYRLLQSHAKLPRIEAPTHCFLCNSSFGLLRNPVNCLFCYAFACKKCSTSTAPASEYESISAAHIAVKKNINEEETTLKCCDACVTTKQPDKIIRGTAVLSTVKHAHLHSFQEPSTPTPATATEPLDFLSDTNPSFWTTFSNQFTETSTSLSSIFPTWSFSFPQTSFFGAYFTSPPDFPPFFSSSTLLSTIQRPYTTLISYFSPPKPTLDSSFFQTFSNFFSKP